MSPLETSPVPTFDDVWRILQETAIGAKELRESQKQTDLQMKETDRIIKALSKELGNLGGRLGQFVEEMVRPAAVRLFQQRGLDVHQVMKNLTAFDDFGQFRSEVDLLVINNRTAIAIECKSHLGMDDVKEHLERMDMFKDCFPQYADFNLLGAVAAMVIPDDVGRYAYKQGLFVMAQNGEAMLIRNDDKFNPKEW